MEELTPSAPPLVPTPEKKMAKKVQPVKPPRFQSAKRAVNVSTQGLDDKEKINQTQPCVYFKFQSLYCLFGGLKILFSFSTQIS